MDIWTEARRNGWTYTGDVSLTQGGLFFKLPYDRPLDGESEDYVEAVEVFDLASAIGGPDCMFLIESGSIYMPRDMWQAALDCCGYRLHTSHDGRDMIWDGRAHHPVDGDGLTLLVDAFRGYAGFDSLTSEVVQIGKLTDFDPDPVMEAGTVLRGNAKLKNHVMRNYL